MNRTFVNSSAALAAIYAALSWLVLTYLSADGAITMVYLPSGVALAALIIGGKRYAIAVFVGAFVANALSNNAYLASTVIAAGSTLGALLGLWLVRRRSAFDRRLAKLSDYLRLMVFGAVLPATVNATLGVTALHLAGFATGTYAMDLLQWWMGDTLGIILMTPLILIWWAWPKEPIDPKWLREAVPIICVTFVAGQIIFLGWFSESLGHMAQAFLMFPLAVWIAMRLGARGTTIALLIVSVQGLLSADAHVGYFAHDLDNGLLDEYWLFVLVYATASFALATFIDEHQLAEAKLAKTQAALQEAQALAKIGSWELDLKLDRVNWSPYIYRLFEIDPKQFGASYKAFLDAIHPDDREYVNKTYLASLSTRLTCTIDHRLLMADGRIKWVQQRVNNDFAADGTPRRSWGTVQDITERKLLEAQLQATKDNLQATLDASPDLVFEMDLDGRCIAHHFARSDSVIAPKAGLIGKLVSEVMPAEAAAIVMATLQEAHTSGYSSGMQLHLPLAHSAAWFELSAARKETPVDETPRFVVISRDITKRVQTEQRQRALERQLLQAQKMELIGQLTGGIAHDFNNILASMLGYAEIVQMSADIKLHPEMEKYVAEILQAGIRAKELVQQLLTFSEKRESLSAAIHVEPIVDEVVKLLQSTLPTSILIKVKIAQGLPQVVISPVQLHQVLMNLGLNARDAVNQTGTIEFIVKTATVERGQACASCHQKFDGRYLMLLVRDTGGGITPENLAQAFDPFFTTKDVGRGSGLGLSMVHGIVHAAKGHIQVRNLPDAGAEFCVYFPCAESSTMEHSPPALQLAADDVHIQAHVLVVDDEVDIVGMLTVLLHSAGCEVTGFTSSTEALRWFEANAQGVDLVITDLTMPDVSGIDLARALLKGRSDLPIILCTGYGDSLNEEMVHQIGIRHLLIKPVPARLLLERVVNCLGTKTSAGPHP